MTRILKILGNDEGNISCSLVVNWFEIKIAETVTRSQLPLNI